MRRLVLLFVTVLCSATLSYFTTSGAHAFEDRDCSDFDTQQQAQNFFLDNNPSQDPHGLDADDDGRACDSLPCPCGTTSSSGSGSTTTTVRERGRITKVVDGDTVKVRLRSGTLRTVRLIGIDTPEVYGTTECGGPRASRSLKRILPRGARVRLVSDPTQARQDRYGRALRYVTKASTGIDVNRAQVLRGWARVYVYNNDPFQRVSRYRDAQRAAQRHDRGVWGLC